jgi:prophage antirepressor-like protein
MNQELKIVKQANFNNVSCNIYQNPKQEIFMTREQVGEALGYSDPRVAITKIHIKHKERLDALSVVTKLVSTDGKTYESYLYSAKGVYEICRWSRQTLANEFMDWTYDVVESIRKHGAYLTPEKIEEVLLNPDMIIGLAMQLKTEMEKNCQLKEKNKTG